MLGLGLVLSSIGLLLGGTLYGIQAYSATVRTTERKMIELEIASRIVGTLKLEPPGTGDTRSPAVKYGDSIEEVKRHLAEFRKINAETIANGWDPGLGEQEIGLCVQLDEAIKQLQKEIKGGPTGNQETTEQLLDKPEVKNAYETARKCAENLRISLYDDIHLGIRHSNRTIRQSMWVVYFATTWALALICTLLYYFRVWMFAPIRQLQAGVARVHGGDFGHPIGLASGDELQELADEFNAMTLRLAAIYADLARQVNERSRQLVRSERMVS